MASAPSFGTARPRWIAFRTCARLARPSATTSPSPPRRRVLRGRPIPIEPTRRWAGPPALLSASRTSRPSPTDGPVGLGQFGSQSRLSARGGALLRHRRFPFLLPRGLGSPRSDIGPIIKRETLVSLRLRPAAAPVGPQTGILSTNIHSDEHQERSLLTIATAAFAAPRRDNSSSTCAESLYPKMQQYRISSTHPSRISSFRHCRIPALGYWGIRAKPYDRIKILPKDDISILPYELCMPSVFTVADPNGGRGIFTVASLLAGGILAN